MVIFKYIEEKDVFMTFYSKSLARRLINGTSASEDLERIMIEKLKVRSRWQPTNNLLFFCELSPLWRLRLDCVWLRVHGQASAYVHRHFVEP